MNNLPIKIRRHREAKFTEKRNLYKKYLSIKWKWTNIFNEIDNKKITIKDISKKTIIDASKCIL